MHFVNMFLSSTRESKLYHTCCVKSQHAQLSKVARCSAFGLCLTHLLPYAVCIYEQGRLARQ